MDIILKYCYHLGKSDPKTVRVSFQITLLFKQYRLYEIEL